MLKEMHLNFQCADILKIILHTCHLCGEPASGLILQHQAYYNHRVGLHRDVSVHLSTSFALMEWFSPHCALKKFCPILYNSPFSCIHATTNYTFVQVFHESASVVPLFLWHMLQLFGFTISNNDLCHFPPTSYVGKPSICIKMHAILSWMKQNWKIVQDFNLSIMIWVHWW